MVAERAAPKQAPESNEKPIRHLEELRTLFRAVIEYNKPLLQEPPHQVAARRRIAEAAREIQQLKREIARLRD